MRREMRRNMKSNAESMRQAKVWPRKKPWKKADLSKKYIENPKKKESLRRNIEANVKIEAKYENIVSLIYWKY